MNCDDLLQNSAAYALGALTNREREEFEQHILECELGHDIEAFSYVASRLSDAVPAIEPPAGLRARILAAAEAESAVLVAQPAGRSLGMAGRGTGIASWLQRYGAASYAAAATVLVVFGALIGWGIAELTSEDPSTDINHFRREPGGEWLRVETELGREPMTLSVGNLERLPDQNTYRFWAIRDDRWVPIGSFNTGAEGRWSGLFEFALQEGDSIAITVEPVDGADTPTSEPEIRSRI